MSTSSTVTTSAEPDLTLGDDDKIANWTCVLVTTHADGTQLCPTSVVMCEGLGWEHAKGVLQLMEMEMVLMVWSDSEMMAAMDQLWPQFGVATPLCFIFGPQVPGS